MRILRNNKEVTWHLLGQFMGTLEERVNNGCHNVNSKNLPQAFHIEGPDDKYGLDIKSDKYHIYLEPKPSAVAGADSLITCYGKSIEDDSDFSIGKHWIKALHLSNRGFVTQQAEPTLAEHGIRPDILCILVDMIFGYEWARYLFSLAMASIKVREAYDVLLEDYLNPPNAE